eukprot:CAMPEP_0177663542 /NCGR_PEP_ID=MMETSP0447-20121125/19974_1 /TAXON_ID=0 /ORGANISM="Stygamoeba regulata, Strain BSH-02190019" /LENGTH=139 /DNA_ID=CAMNT_0019169371 /DNA_START=33 /DNA_END=452 /DNA_ORIENTATION=+
MSSVSTTFMIVGKDDTPLYEVDLGGGTSSRDQGAHLRQFVLHAALDVVDETVWKTSSLFLKTVDRYQNMYISALVSPGNVRLLLLHEQRTDEGTVKQFFQDVHELYLKVLLNPFYQLNSPITSVSFDARVKGLARRLRS